MTTVTKEKKKEVIEKLRENISKQKGIFFVSFKGIKGEDSRELRSQLKKEGSGMMVARKTLAKIAFEKEGIDFDPLTLEGEAGFIFGFEDGISTAKVAKKFAKDEKITLLGGVYEGKILTVDEVNAIADLPSREELIAKLLGTMSAPTSGFVRVLQGNIRGLLTVLAKAKQE